MSEDKKILVTLDGSKRAERTIDYLCSFKPFKEKHLTLFNITTPVPETYYDLSRNAFSKVAVSQVKAWEMGQKKMMADFMENTRKALISAGFESGGIEVKLERCVQGITRGILKEVQSGEYEALVIRRRGTENSILGVTMGSVAAKLVEKQDSIPLIVAGTREIKHYLCIAVDGSDGSMRAVRFTAGIMGKFDCRILLCAVMRAAKPTGTDDPFAEMSNQAYSRLEQALAASKDVLVEAGISEDRIETRLIEGASSRAAAVLDTARKAECDTLVMGRKGRSEVENFDLGRIPRKIIYSSRKFSIWMIP